jgi:hypothetical protein
LEGASALALLAAALAFAGLAPDRLRTLWAAPAALLLLGAREMDWDKAFLSEGVFQLRLYSGSAPILHKAAGAAAVLLLLAVLWRLARLAPRWLAALRGGAGWARALAAALLLGAIAKSLDGLARKLEPLGIDVPRALNAGAARVEEVLELGFALLLAWAVTSWAARRASCQP